MKELISEVDRDALQITSLEKKKKKTFTWLVEN